MAFGEFTITDLRRILHEASGATDGDGVRADTVDTDLAQLGYDSLAVLETGGRIEREFGVELDDETLLDSTTPRALIEAVNARLAREAS
ncbi:acyl carrier protein [Actinomadura bangladeshensis]|uniref:Acyl carrier protein n=1 Tax=Actinomadura bangladeshensis TaxID=453573 RepID=A0A4R4PC52_9ACTN|nr:acyl carrier protein [Actinomadura bangladeshensis]TDC19544.1 acyl carrier protein [Actinomadura bangladeshensis]